MRDEQHPNLPSRWAQAIFKLDSPGLRSRLAVLGGLVLAGLVTLSLIEHARQSYLAQTALVIYIIGGLCLASRAAVFVKKEHEGPFGAVLLQIGFVFSLELVAGFAWHWVCVPMVASIGVGLVRDNHWRRAFLVPAHELEDKGENLTDGEQLQPVEPAEKSAIDPIGGSQAAGEVLEFLAGDERLERIRRIFARRGCGRGVVARGSPMPNDRL